MSERDTRSSQPGASGKERSSGRDPSSPAPSSPTSSSQGSSNRGQVAKKQTRGGSFAAPMILLLTVLLLSAIFILQNTQPVEVSFLGWSWEVPLAATILLSVASGLLIATLLGIVRILQLRRNVKRARRA